MYMLLPGAVLYAIMKPGQKTEAELRQELETKYSAQIKKNEKQRHAMQQCADRGLALPTARARTHRFVGTSTT